MNTLEQLEAPAKTALEAEYGSEQQIDAEN